jgi:hypothetical protein
VLLARELDRGERVAQRQRDEWVGLVVAVVDVVRRLELPDVEARDLLHHQRDLLPLVLPAGVLAHPLAQRLGFADVEHSAVG